MIERVDVDGARLAVRRWGASGVPIVALHPGVGDLRIWRECAEIWAASGHRVVAYDRRGFGSTEYRPTRHRDVDDLAAVVDATTDEPVVLVGNSRGGGIALDFASARPASVDALVLVSPSPSGYPVDRWRSVDDEDRLDEAVAAAEAAGDLAAVNRLEVRYWLDGVDQPEGRVGGAARELMLDMNARALAAAPIGDAVVPPPVWERLSDIETPTLVLVGEHDLPGYHTLAAEMGAAMPDARVAVVPDSAHCPPLDQPRRLAESVGDFLRAR